MSDILIKNMELPKGNDYLHLIIQGGKVHTAISCGHLTTDKLNVADAIEVKPHGRLIDADKLKQVMDDATENDKDKPFYKMMYSYVIQVLAESPTVLEATK